MATPAAAFTGLIAGGAVGSMVGALIGAGIPEQQAKAYDEQLKAGGILVGVTPKAGQSETLRHFFNPEESPAARAY
jgi:hypothetical protein